MSCTLQLRNQRVAGVLPEVLRHVRLDMAQLRAEDSGSSWWLLGSGLLLGQRRSAEQDAEEAYACYSRAADKGHLLSLYWKGFML